MKKWTNMPQSLVGAALLTLAGTGYGQTSVTLYGIVDAGVEYANHQPGNGNSVVRLTAGNISGSRWGIRGTEELGGGLKGVFVLESGFDTDTGKSAQGGRLFGRNAYVGLSSTWGSVLLGRQNNALYDYVSNYEPMALATKYSVINQDISFIGRADNTVKYVGVFGGLKASGFYSFGADTTVANGAEIPGNPKIGREFGGYFTYDIGQFSVGAAYDEINTGTVTVNPDAKVRKVSAGANYVIGPVKTFVGYRWARGYDGGVVPGSIAGFGNQGSNLYWAGASWQFSPAWTFSGAAYLQDFRNTGNDPWLFSLNADYALSKRSHLYTSVGYVKNKGTSNLGFYDSGKSFGNTNPGQNQFGVTVGMRHIL